MKQASSPAASRGRLLVLSAIGAYFAVLLVGGLLNTDVPVISPKLIIYLNPWIYGIALVAVTAILWVYGTISRTVVAVFTWLATVLYAVYAAASGGSYYLTFAMCGLVAAVTMLVAPDVTWQKPLVCSPMAGKIAVGSVAVAVGGGTLFLLLSAYVSHTSSPVMSTGVYAQMMASLRDSFSMDTTLEFGEAVSHWVAHISPIFLLYLPFYALIPSPATLMVLQTLAVFSAVIPLWLIARRKGLSAGVSAALCALLCLFPAVWGAAAGGIHEYALLLPLLLWLLWSLESGRRALVWIFAALVLCVRETAAIHLVAVGLYWVFSHKDTEENRKVERRQGYLLAASALVYLIVAWVVLTYAGKGTLITRYDNVTGMYATDFGTLIREIIFNPALCLYEMLTEAKLHYLLCVLLPLGLIPFLSRKKAGLTVLIPLLLLNLLPDFSYHYNTNFPYSFGVAALLLYLCADALADYQLRRPDGRLAARWLVVAVCSAVIVGAFRIPDWKDQVDYAISNDMEYTTITEMLDTLDKDASVSASGRLCVSLADRSELYSLSAKADTEYVVLDLRDEWALAGEADYTEEYYEKLGYTKIKEHKGIIAILKK